MFLLPSRGRPASVLRFFTAWKETKASTEGVLWIDEDEIDIYAEACGALPPKWVVISAPRASSLGSMINIFFAVFPDEPWYGLIADDLLPSTPHWDTRLIEAAGSDGLAYGDDGITSEHGTHPVVGGDLVRRLGWLALPGCTRTYIDNALSEVARRAGKLHYLPHVKTEHLHFSNGKSEWDEQYRKPDVAADREIYHKWLSTLSA